MSGNNCVVVFHAGPAPLRYRCLVLLEDVLVRFCGSDADRLEICQVLRIGNEKELGQVDM